MDQPGTVANPARGQLNRENMNIFPCPRSRQRIWSRGTGSAVPSPVILHILHTHPESGPYSRGSSRFPNRRPLISPYTTGSVPSLSGQASVYPLRVHCRESAGTGPVGSSSKGCCLCRYHHEPINVRLSFVGRRRWYT